jgi:hypothetical protein
MLAVEDAAPAPVTPPPPTLPPERHPSVRLHLLLRAFGVAFTSLLGVVPFALWITSVALAPVTLLAPLVLPTTALVRGYANTHRRRAARLLGTPMPEPYRADEGRGPLRRIWQIVRDPASWRDAWWLFCHAVVGPVTAVLNIALFAGGVFYLIYPFLFWVTPERVFDHPFGHHSLHSATDATVMMPLSLVCFGLWFVLVLPLTRLELATTHALLRRPD